MAYLYTKNKFLSLIVIVLFCPIFFSCNIDVTLRENENLTYGITVNVTGSREIEEAMHGVLKLVDARAIFDQGAIVDKLTKSKANDISVTTTSLCNLNASFVTETVSDLFPEKNSLITHEKNITTITLDEQTVNDCLAMLPDESLTVLDLLSAPIFTQENLGEEEYLQNISVLYGENIVNLLKPGTITLSFKSQKPVKSAKSEPSDFATCDVKKNEVKFTIPLVKLLCLRERLLLTISR